MTSTPVTAAPTKPARLPREEDPRNPVHRLRALLDEGTLELITPDDDSGMIAAVGLVAGTRVVAFCSDATVMGGAMGDVGCRVVVDAYHRAMTDGVPIIGLWHSGCADPPRGGAWQAWSAQRSRVSRSWRSLLGVVDGGARRRRAELGGWVRCSRMPRRRWRRRSRRSC